MRQLPDRPDLDQLRHQARELLRAARAGDEDAIHRLLAVSNRQTLGTAQLALAREHGFTSWTRLKSEVKRRRGVDSPNYVIRPVQSVDELTSVFDFLGAQVTPGYTHSDRRFQELADRFPEDRSLMLVVADRRQVVGGLLACRRGSGVTPRAIGFAPGLNQEDLMTRLLQTLEAEARRLGATEIYEGGSVEPRDLYERLGYFGRNPVTKHLLPLPGRAREARLRRLASHGAPMSGS